MSERIYAEEQLLQGDRAQQDRLPRLAKNEGSRSL